MAYKTQGGRVVKVVKRPSAKQLRKQHLRKFGISADELQARMKASQDLAQRVLYVVAATLQAEAHTNPNHRRNMRKQYDVSHRQLNRSDKAWKREASQ